VDPHAGPFDYDPEAASNLRAAALKELATLPEARDAFQPRSELVPEPPRDPETGAFLEPVEWPSLPAGGRAFTDELPGQLRTLTVYTTLGRSASGILSEWPDSEDSFVVVEVPHAPEPARPVIARASWQPPEDPPPEVPEAGAARVELLIAEPPEDRTAPVTSYEVYRTLDPGKTGDYRLMRPLHSLDTPVYEEQDIPGLTEIPTATRMATYIDPTVSPWRTYYYRVVARAPGLGGASRGMRSAPSALVRVNTLSGSAPPPPSDVTTLRVGPTVQILFEAEAPTTPVGDFRFDILQLTGDGPLIVARATATQARQAIPNRYQIEADGLSAGDEVVVRVTDPLGLQAESPPVTIA
jgi:hypothetical protein